MDDASSERHLILRKQKRSKLLKLNRKTFVFADPRNVPAIFT